MDGLQLGMDGGSVFDLGDCPHTVFVLLQLPAERGGGLVQVRNCGIQILDGVQRMGFQVVHARLTSSKVSDSAFQFCLARPIAALLIAEIEVVHQQVGQRGFFRLFQSVQKKLLLFRSGLRSSVAAHGWRCGWTASGCWLHEYHG